MAQAIRYYATHRSEGRVQGQNARRYVEAHFDRTVLAQGLLDIMQALWFERK